MTVELFVLRLVHVLGGIFWVGTVLFTTFFLAPVLAASGAGAAPIMAALRERRLMTYLPLAAVLTILSGARLMWLASAGVMSAYVATAAGRTFALAGAAATAAFLIGILVGRPAAIRAAQLGGALASAPAERREAMAAEAATLRRRNAAASAVVAALLIVGAAGMAVARYLR